MLSCWGRANYTRGGAVWQVKSDEICKKRENYVFCFRKVTNIDPYTAIMGLFGAFAVHPASVLVGVFEEDAGGCGVGGERCGCRGCRGGGGVLVAAGVAVNGAEEGGVKEGFAEFFRE